MRKSLEEIAHVFSGSDYKKNPPGNNVPIFGSGGLMGFTSTPLYNGPAVLSGRKGSINNPIYIEGDFWNVDTIFCIKAKIGIDTKWLYYNFLNTDLTQLNEATGVPSVNSKALYKLKFKWFDFPEQTKIARILSTCDAAIEKTQASIIKYKALKQGMLHDLFTRGIDITTGKLRPKYEEAPELYKESKLGVVPREWDVNQLSSVIEVINGGTPSTYMKEYWNGEIPWLSVEDFNNGERYVSSALKKITSEGLKNSSTNLLLPGMILVSARGTVGVISQIKVPMAFNQSCYGLNSTISDLTNDYLYYFLIYYRQNFGFSSFGSVFSTITREYFDSMYITMNLKNNEQELIVNGLAIIDQKLNTEQHYLHKLQTLKQGLMGDLLSGRKRVKTIGT